MQKYADVFNKIPHLSVDYGAHSLPCVVPSVLPTVLWTVDCVLWEVLSVLSVVVWALSEVICELVVEDWVLGDISSVLCVDISVFTFVLWSELPVDDSGPAVDVVRSVQCFVNREKTTCTDHISLLC